MTGEEYNRIRPRDVLLYRGRYRPVLAVSRGGVTFPILRCSWTDRPITIVLKGEVMRYGSVTGFRVKSFADDEMWRLLEREHYEITHGDVNTRVLTCSAGVTEAGRRFLQGRVSSSDTAVR